MKFLIPLTLLASTSALATAPSVPPLHYQTGQIPILGGQATLNTSTTLRYLDAADAKRVIVDLWGNPPEAAEDVQGMILPMTDLLAKNGWGVVITEAKDGHVKDNDAANMNYTKIMKDLQAGSAERNAERQKAGYPAVDLVGWADTPSYDAVTHKMYWAKELAFHEAGQPDGEHTLNYAVRVLGRDNVMELNAVAGMSQLPQIKQDMQAVLQQVSFNPGHRYQDFNGSTDKLATYGVAGLLGVVAAKKVGFLALALVFLKKGFVLILAAFGALGRLFKRNTA